MIVQALLVKDRWPDIFHHQQALKQEVYSQFHPFQEDHLGMQVITLGIERIQMCQVMVINKEETNPFQVSVREIIGRLESTLELHLVALETLQEKEAG
jgi:hypothetical protein